MSTTPARQPNKGAAGAARRSEKLPIFRALGALLIPPIEAIVRFRIVDGHKVPAEGAFVLSPNHFSEIDPIIIGRVMYKLGRMPRFMTKASLFKIPVAGWFLRTAGQIPVERTGVIRGQDPITAARKIANDGHALVIYPEGSLTRDPDLWPMRGKTGAVRMALLAGIPLIPAAHWGTQLVMPRYGKGISLFPRKTVTVKFGDPVDLTEFAGKGLDPTTLHAATAKLMAAITALLEDLRAEKAPGIAWDPAKNNQSETGRF